MAPSCSSRSNPVRVFPPPSKPVRVSPVSPKSLRYCRAAVPSSLRCRFQAVGPTDDLIARTVIEVDDQVCQRSRVCTVLSEIPRNLVEPRRLPLVQQSVVRCQHPLSPGAIIRDLERLDVHEDQRHGLHLILEFIGNPKSNLAAQALLENWSSVEQRSRG